MILLLKGTVKRAETFKAGLIADICDRNICCQQKMSDMLNSK